MYVANRYVRVRGKLYAYGEIVPETMSADNIDRLLAVGAIVEVASTGSSIPVIEEEEAEIAEIDALDGIAEQPTKKKAERRKRK